MLEVSHATEMATYLGFTIKLLDERELTIYTPQGRLIFHGRATLSTARRIIRGYRKEDGDV